MRVELNPRVWFGRFSSLDYLSNWFCWLLLRCDFLTIKRSRDWRRSTNIRASLSILLNRNTDVNKRCLCFSFYLFRQKWGHLKEHASHCYMVDLRIMQLFLNQWHNFRFFVLVLRLNPKLKTYSWFFTQVSLLAVFRECGRPYTVQEIKS